MRTGWVSVTTIVMALALGGGLWPSPAGADNLCCTITSIDSRSGVVTARDNTTRGTFQFKVTDQISLNRLKVGQSLAVSAAESRRTGPGVPVGGKTPGGCPQGFVRPDGRQCTLISEGDGKCVYRCE